MNSNTRRKGKATSKTKFSINVSVRIKPVIASLDENKLKLVHQQQELAQEVFEDGEGTGFYDACSVQERADPLAKESATNGKRKQGKGTRPRVSRMKSLAVLPEVKSTGTKVRNRRGSLDKGSGSNSLQGKQKGSVSSNLTLTAAHLWEQGTVCLGTDGQNQTKRFDFCQSVVAPTDTQQDTYNACMPHLVDAFIDGYNCTLLAYGQTGSGKTHTVFGPPGSLTEASLAAARETSGTAVVSETYGDVVVPLTWGLLPRTLLTVLHRLEGEQGTLTASAVEVYFDNVYDLLNKRQAVLVGEMGASLKRQFVDYTNKRRPINTDRFGNRVAQPENHRKRCQDSQDKDFLTSKHTAKDGRPTQTFELKGESETPITSALDVVRLVRLVEATRVARTHNINERSSRSHCIVTVRLAERKRHSSAIQSSKFLFVDLAGSERIKKTGSIDVHTRRNEAVNINSSLTALGRTIRALGESSKSGGSSSYIPYRDSALTMLLKQSFGGSCRTAMIVNIAQEPQHSDETLSSLRFGERSALVKNRVVKQDPQPDRISVASGKQDAGSASRESDELAMAEAELADAQGALKQLAAKGLGGGVSDTASTIDKDAFKDYSSRLAKHTQSVETYKQELSELAAQGKQSGSQEYDHLLTRKRNAERQIHVLNGLVVRMTFSGVYRKPSPLFVQKQAEVDRLVGRVAQLRRLLTHEK